MMNLYIFDLNLKIIYTSFSIINNLNTFFFLAKHNAKKMHNDIIIYYIIYLKHL